MKNLLKKINLHLQNFITDKMLYKIVILNFLIFIIRFSCANLYDDSSLWYFKGTMNLMISMCGAVFYRKGLLISLVIYSFFLLFTNSSTDFTDWFIILCATSVAKKKIRMLILSLYGFAVIVKFSYKGLEIPSMCIYVLCCLIFLVLTEGLVQKKISSELILTDDEKKILEQLRRGKHQKEITDFSKNTVTKKLKTARDRNNIATTQELIMRYIQETQ